MVSSKMFPELAAHVLDTLNVRDGEAIYISGGAHHQEFLEELGIQVARRGGQPFISAVSNDYQKRLLETCSVDQMKRTPKILKGALEAMDKYVVIEPYSDPSFKTQFREKLQSRSEGMYPIIQIIYSKPGKPWTYMGWATEGMAKMYGVSLEVLERLVIGGCNIDYAKLHADCEHVMSVLSGATRVHITDPHGTDFWLNIEGRRLNADDGIWSAEKAAQGDTGGNLPAGEVFVAPVETKGEGTIYCPVTIDDLTRSVLIKGALLYFQDGMLVPEKCTATEGQDVLRDTLAKFIEIDLQKYGAPQALKVAELGIGLNPVIDRSIGYILTDEKIGGSVHVAFGMSEGYGGAIMSNMHWDFVTAPDETLEVEYMDGSKKLLLKDGKLLR